MYRTMQNKVNITYDIYSFVINYLSLITIRSLVSGFESNQSRSEQDLGFDVTMVTFLAPYVSLLLVVDYHCLVLRVGLEYQRLSLEFLCHHSFHSFLHILHYTVALSSPFCTSPSGRLLFFVTPCSCRKVERVLWGGGATPKVGFPFVLRGSKTLT